MIELQLPNIVSSDSDAVEHLRVWSSKENPIVLVERCRDWEPEMWGLLIADIATHVAGMLQQGGVEDHQLALKRLRSAFDAELDHPTN